MKRSKIGLILVASLILNTLFMFQPAGVSQVEAAFPGYNGKIAFVSYRNGNQEIYVMDANGQNELRLTNTSAVNRDPSWSPDGTKIVFDSDRDGNCEVYVMDADGTNQTRLTNASGCDFGSRWSPDGDKIAFTTNRHAGGSEIYIMDADGTNQTRLTDTAGGNFELEWSPDGNKIAFSSTRDGVGAEIYVMDSDGTNQVNVSNVAGHDWGPKWLGNSQQLIYSSDRTGNNELYKVNADGSGEEQLTDTASNDDSYLSLSYRLDKLAFVRFDADWEAGLLGLANSDGSDLELIDFSDQNLPLFEELNWSSDQLTILATGYYPGWADSDIFTISADGGELTQLTTDGNSWDPNWQPIPNTAPVLAAKTSSVQSGASSLVDVLSGSTDEEALSGSHITITTPPSHGLAIVESGKVKYTADADYAGSDSLIYEVCDSFMLDQQCATKTLNLTIKPALGLAKIGTTQTTGSTKVETTNTKPTFSGTTTPLATVTVEIHSDPIVLTTTADSSGSWSVTPDSPLPPGDHTVYISSTLNGQTTELNSFVLGISQQLPNAGADTLGIFVIGLTLLISGGALYYYDRRHSWRRHMPSLFR